VTLPPSPLLNRDLRINSFGTFLRRRFGCRVSKVNVDAGFTCPNRDGSRGIGGCIYCDNSSFSPDATQASIPIEEQYMAGADYHRTRLGSTRFIVYFQKFTNTYGSVERLRDLYQRALALPDVVGISVGTRPDALTDEALDLLAELARHRYICIELGLQSMDDAILARINRGHSLEEYLATVERIRDRGIDLCTHLIHGFPGETAAGFLATADLMNRLPINSIKLHQLHAVKGTRLADLYYSGEFSPISQSDYVATVCDFLERLRPDIAIQRLYGSAPLSIRVAPTWDLKNNQMWYAIINELKRRGTWQGCRVAA
jgi:radical SAM protein (TIGR01212 family)